jgi:K+-transporting ATPase ATPase C chain
MKTFRAALTLLVLFTVLTGVLYPLAVYAASGAFAGQRKGSLVTANGVVVGSKLIGQPFTSLGHFWGRPSATSPQPYNAQNSSGSNLGPTNSALSDAVKARVQALHDADPDNSAPVPIDLVTASASGLDPHISPAAAYYQVHRVATVRHIDEAKVKDLVTSHIEGRDLGFLGEPRVNVLMLNVALDSLAGGPPDP